jgi:PhzF family phenazine biosynthesis protein
LISGLSGTIAIQNNNNSIQTRKTKHMALKMYQVDAFTSSLFSGNPAAVCILDEWPDDVKMQNIASENNLSETAFVVREGERFIIRWFTPGVEVDLCGHATLAAAHVLFEHLRYPEDLIEFHSPHSGRLTVEKSGDLYVMDFPADTPEEIRIPEMVTAALHKSPVKAFQGKSDLMLVFASQSEVETMRPDFSLLAQWDSRGVIVTAMGGEVDFVSRFFAPRTGINEDPVTGSAHTTLTPYWSRVLGKKSLTARQLSARGGELVCENRGERIRISGRAVTYLIGEIFL